MGKWGIAVRKKFRETKWLCRIDSRPWIRCSHQSEAHWGKTTDEAPWGYSTLLIRICVRPQRTKQARNIKYLKKMRANLLIWKRTTQTGGGKEVEGGKSGWENDGRWFGCAFFWRIYRAVLKTENTCFTKLRGGEDGVGKKLPPPMKNPKKCRLRLQRMKMSFCGLGFCLESFCCKSSSWFGFVQFYLLIVHQVFIKIKFSFLCHFWLFFSHTNQ